MSIPNKVYKAHATGNDFVVYADPDGVFEPTADEARFLCDRHFGIGGDGLIRLTPPDAVSDLDKATVEACMVGGARWFMDYRNADGSLAEMCGNGTRAITLFAQKQGYADAPGGEPFKLATRAGIKILTSLGDVEPYGRDVFQVDMGAWKRGGVGAFEVTIPGMEGAARGTFVDMGNPHVVSIIGGLEFVSDNTDAVKSDLPDVEKLDLVMKPIVAPVLESDQNVEFVRIDAVRQTAADDDAAVGDAAYDDAAKGGVTHDNIAHDGSAEFGETIGYATMRVNERGCGETLSCGTGLCATAIVLRAHTGIDHWNITVRGGTLRVDVTDDDVKLTGSATIVGAITLQN